MKDRFVYRFILGLCFVYAGLWGCGRDETTHVTEKVSESPPSSAAETSAEQPPTSRFVTKATSTQPVVESEADTTSVQAKPITGRSTTAVGLQKNSPIINAMQELIASWKNVRTVHIEVATEMELKRGMRENRTGKGYIDYLRKDGKVYFRQYRFDNFKVERSPEDFILSAQRTIVVFDGEYVYRVDELSKGKVAAKMTLRQAPIQSLGGLSLMRQMKGHYKLELEDAEEIDGEPVHVFRGISKSGATTTRYFIQRSTGMLRRLRVEDLDKKMTLKVDFTNAQFNVDFPDDHFVFVPPDDVEVKDLTGAASNGTGKP